MILLAVICVSGILATQVLWINQALEVQQTQRELRVEQITAEAKRFNDRVVIALSNVANKILSINNDPTDVFQAVEQVRPNFYTVSINDTVHPYLLESLLIREFDRRNISEDFEYGIYDCFTDSIVYGNFVPIDSDTTGGGYKGEPPQIRWDKDGHYFSVFFPKREIYEPKTHEPELATWAFSSAILLIVFGFFGYSLYVMLRQKRLSEVKTDFINNMTHELKTPISTISLSSEVLLREGIENNPDRLRKYAQIINLENQRLKGQVDRVLQLSALDKNKINLKEEKIDLHELIERCVNSFRLTVEERGGEVQTDLQANSHTIVGDSMHLTNIVLNLLDNANKYTTDKPLIKIATTNRNGRVILKVKDNGIGISREIQKNIFDKFYRVPTGDIHDAKGFGLGLYYVKMMVEAHGGEISVRSNKGEGSEFSVSLPLKSNNG